MAAYLADLLLAKSDGSFYRYRDGAVIDATDPLAKAGFALVLDEQFDSGSLNARWHPYDPSSGDSTFGSPTRIQIYHAANAVVGAGSFGATGGTSLKLLTQETDAGSGTLPSTGSAGTRYSYTAGMLDSKTAGVYYPRYGWFEWRTKIPHGQGLWPSYWLTAKNGGATTAEFDVLEYFHSQLPAKNSTTLHGTDNTGTFHANRYTNNGAGGASPRTFFEAPTYTPGWHTWAAEIVPVTDSTGTTIADPALPSSYVRLRVFLDGVQVVQFVDTSATWWTTNGGDADSFWNVYMQGCQVDGNFVGHPEDALGYSHWTNACLISGSPGSCATTTGGYSVQRAHFNDPASTAEIDYFRCYKYTG